MAMENSFTHSAKLTHRRVGMNISKIFDMTLIKDRSQPKFSLTSGCRTCQSLGTINCNSCNQNALNTCIYSYMYIHNLAANLLKYKRKKKAK